MTFPLGRYGDNHVAPDMLFDPNDPAAGPPPDAVDVQFRCPSSLNVMLDGMAQADREDLLDQWRAVYAEVAEEAVTYLQRSGGWVTDRERSGLAPARLAITAVMHGEVPGFAVARWHLHLYVAAVGVSLLDGQRLPVDPGSIDLGMRGPALRRYITQLEARTAELWDLRWDRPQLGAGFEIVEPPWHGYIDSLDRGVCPGPAPWGPRETMVADAEAVRIAAESTERMARNGPGFTRAKLLDEMDDEEFRARVGD